METLLKITKNDIEAIELPYQSIHWDYNGVNAFYDNKDHTIDCDDYMLVFHLTLSGVEGDEYNNAWVGEIKEFWLGEDEVELSPEEEERLRKKLVKHFDNPFNAN